MPHCSLESAAARASGGGLAEGRMLVKVVSLGCSKLITSNHLTYLNNFPMDSKLPLLPADPVVL